MKVGAIQSCYVPWRGYFDFIASVDLFVLYDDVQYSRGSWRNRNKVKTETGLRWMTVPARYDFGARIDEVRIGQQQRSDWRATHRQLLERSLGSAPFFEDAIRVWESAVIDDLENLSALNEALIRKICGYVDITTPIVRSSRFELNGARTERLVSLLQAVDATAYLSGPSAKGYITEALFRKAGIRLEYKRYSYPNYPQLWGSFQGFVTVLDLIANCGPDSRRYLNSLEADEVAVP